MSALTPHIKVLRAEAEALKIVVDEWCDQATKRRSLEGLTISCVLFGMAMAKSRAADVLEAEDRRLAEI